MLVVLQWADLWNQASEDFDLYGWIEGGPVFSSTNPSGYGYHPQEMIVIRPNVEGQKINGDATILVKWVNYYTGSTKHLRLLTYPYGSGSDCVLSYRSTDEQVYGHSASEYAISVAASNAATPNAIADYSSRGSSQMLPFGNSNLVSRNTPTITATDGVQTKIGVDGNFINPFTGTSASAPHVAAIAALYYSKYPYKTPSDFFSDMTTTAKKVGDIGQDGVYNGTSGYGKIDAYRTLIQAMTVINSPQVNNLDAYWSQVRVKGTARIYSGRKAIISFNNTCYLEGSITFDDASARLQVDGTLILGPNATVDINNMDLGANARIVGGNFISVTVNQLDEQSAPFDSVGRWFTGLFKKNRAPFTFTTWNNSLETFRARQDYKIGTTQKYNNWNQLSDVSNHHSFTISSNNRQFSSYFKTSQNGIIIKNELIDAPSIIGGAVEFKDPWLIDYADPLYGNNKRNQGMSAPFKSRSSPFIPDTSTPYNGDVYQGVFLNQGLNPQGQLVPPYYSVRVPQTQTIGNIDSCNFLGWSVTGTSQVVNPTSLMSPVIFKQANDTIKAKYKGHLASSNPNVTGNNNQRKIMYDGVSAYHMVYESAGDIWYTKSTDVGQTWINEMKISEPSPNGDSSKNPSIYCYNDNGNIRVQVVWTQDWSVYFREYTSSDDSWGYISGVSFVQGPPSLLGSIAKPVISKGWVVLQYPKDAQGTTKAIAVLKYNQGAWRQSVDMPGVSNQVGRAAIYFDDLNKLHVVCEDTGSIFYNAAQMGNSDPVWTLSSSTNISSGSGRSNNSLPSIDGRGQLAYVVWEGQNSSTQKKEIILRTKNSYNVWSSCTYFGCSSTCNSQLNFYEPVVNKLSTYQMGLVWRDQTNNIWGSRLDENTSYEWMVYKLNAIALHPTLYNDNSGNAKVLYTQNSGTAPYRLGFTEISSIAPKPAPYFPPNGTNNTGLGVWLGWNCTYGASTYRVQISTDETFASNIIMDQSGITGTSVQSTGLTYSTTYYWRVKATIGSWTTEWSDVWSFTTLTYSPPGCPYVFSKVGNDFIIDNNILPQSEYSVNKDKTVTDHYKLLASPTLDDGKYILEFREFERERTKLDEVKLLTVDHALNTDIAVLPEGEIVEYIPAYRLVKDQDNDLFENLTALEGHTNIATKGDQYVLHFEPTLEEYSSMDNLEGGMLLGGWIVNDGITTSRIIDPKKQSVGIVGGGSKGVVGTSSPFTFRERATLVYVPLEKLEPEINISFIEKVAFDFASLVVKVNNPTYKVHELNLDEAKHSKLGNITNTINTKDGLTEEIYPDESIKLKFSAPPVEQGHTRSFILVSNGRYERIKEGELLTRIPKEFQLDQNYPNPFNPQTTLRYQLAKSGHVTISVYNQLGQVVAMLVDESKEAGYYETVWDANGTPSGTYYLRMSVTDQFGKQLYLDTKKVVVMK